MTARLSFDELNRLANEDQSALMAIQQTGLAQALNVAWHQVPFYQQIWQQRTGERPPSATPPFGEWLTWSVADLRKSIEQYPPFGNLYVPQALSEVVSVYSSTGTTGRPRTFPVTRADIASLDAQYRRFMNILQIESSDIAVITSTFGLPRGAWSWLQAFHSVGATTIAASSGRVTPPDKLLDIMMSTGATVIQATGSYLAHITRRAEELGIDIRNSRIRAILSGGESASPALRRHLCESWGASLGMMFASTDVSWIAVECAASVQANGTYGMHVLEDSALIEILDPEGRPCPPGEEGEVVITSWVRPSTPRIRFRTGDRAAMAEGRCECGWYGARLMPITGRVDEAVRFHGQTIWASAVEQLLLQHIGVATEFYLEQRQPIDGSPELLVLALERLHERTIDPTELAEKLRAALNVRFTVELLQPGAATAITGVAGSGKTRRVIRAVASTA